MEIEKNPKPSMAKRLVVGIIKTAKSLKKKPQKMQVREGQEIVTQLSDDIALVKHIKALAVLKIHEIKEASLERERAENESILEVISETNREINALTGNHTTLNDSVIWFDLTELKKISLVESEYELPNDNFTEAEKLFNQMIDKYQDKESKVFVGLRKMAKSAFTLTRGGRVKLSAINVLRNNDGFAELPEWELVKDKLSNCTDTHKLKMSLSVSSRETLSHNWQVLSGR
jgi:hypothetical protein